MKRALAALVLALAATAAYAACSTFSYTGADGTTVFCITCCYAGGGCHTTCS